MILKEKKGTVKTFVIAVLAILAAVEGICIGMLMYRSKPTEETKEETGVITEFTDDSGEKTVELYTIATDAVDFTYGTLFADRVYAEVNDNDVSFFADVSECKNMKLFTIEVNGDKENFIGTILDKNDQEVTVGLVQYPYEGSIKAETASRLGRIRETLIDDIISNLQFVEGPYQTNSEDPFLQENMAFDSQYMQLFYPKMWENNVSITESGETVEFYCCLKDREPIKIFSVRFNDYSVKNIGTVDDIPVAIMLETIQEDKDWSEEEREIVYTMQEDSSVIIDGLIMFNGLVLNN